MSWYAVEAIDEAVKDTKELLLPFDLGTWLRLALLVTFTGGGLGFVNPTSFIPLDSNSVEGGSTTDSEVIQSSDTLTESGQNAITGSYIASSSMNGVFWAVLGLSLIGILVLVFYISSVFEFIYYQSLVDKDVSIRDNFRRHWLNGLQYLVFETVYLLIIISLIIGIGLGFVTNVFVGFSSLIIALPVFLILMVFAGLVHDFALLQMIKEKENLISGWKSIWPNLRNQWKEVVVYIFVKVGIGIVIGIAVTTLIFGLLIPLIILFGIVGIILGLVAEVLILIPLIAGILTLGVLMLAATIIIRTFTYFFIIKVYQKITSKLE